MDHMETPFQIDIPEESIRALRQKLEITTFPDELEDAGLKYGAPLENIKRLVSQWKVFDWRQQEVQLNNELPQFTRDIEVDGFRTLNIHYVHQQSKVANAIPLLFVHGWPGNFLECRKILPLLLNGGSKGPSFHVVTVSLPGFGFSEGPKQKDFGVAQYAEVCHKVMLALGYKEYVTQGGDWGFFITKKIGLMYGEKHCKAWHTNMPIVRQPSALWSPVAYFSPFFPPYEQRRKDAARTQETVTQGAGYRHLQSTKPQTLGYGLADSPAGLLAWIYEKMVAWTDEYPWEDDEVLTWISIYWFSRAGPAASIRIYHDGGQTGHPDFEELIDPYTRSSIPLGVSYFPKELDMLPRSWSRCIGNLVQETEHEKGGHFAAHETPEALVDDVRKMFGRDGPAFNVVPGKSGYADSEAEI